MHTPGVSNKPRIGELHFKQYPHNFTGQMVEDFEWVLKMLGKEEEERHFDPMKANTELGARWR